MTLLVKIVCKPFTMVIKQYVFEHKYIIISYDRNYIIVEPLCRYQVFYVMIVRVIVVSGSDTIVVGGR
jgi:hypothetical protein